MTWLVGLGVALVVVLALDFYGEWTVRGRTDVYRGE